MYEKRFTKKDTNLLAKRKERFEKRKELMAKLNSKDVDSPREKHLNKEVDRKMKQRTHMEEIVKQNQERIRAETDANRENMMNRIQDNKERMDLIAEEKTGTQLQRTLRLKEKLMERDCLEDRLRSAKNSPRAVSPESPPGE